MIKVNFRSSELKIKCSDGVEKIFDNIRKRWFILTPEEWVRQNLLQYLVHTMKYPSALMAIEKEIRLGELRKRCDIVIYSRISTPWMIIECKEMDVTLDQKVIDQILRYNISLPSDFLVITNGSHCYGFKKESNVFNEISEFPKYVA